MQEISNLLYKAKETKSLLALLSAQKQAEILQSIASELKSSALHIIQENAKDLANAKGKIADVMLDRLRLDEERINGMAKGVLDVALLESPIGEIESEIMRPNGLKISKVRVPIGVIAIIYESRPNVTTDAAALCIRSSNVCVLRGGSEAILTNTALVEVIRKAIAQNGGPRNAVQLVQDTSHASVQSIMQARGYVDLLIPRGGKGLINAVVSGAKGVPVVETGTGICHVYVDEHADIEMAVSILNNAKTSRPSVCNAAEVCLVHEKVAKEFLPKAKILLEKSGVEFRLDKAACKIIEGSPANEDDFDTEFNDYILSVAVVGSLNEAIEHINKHSTGHSEAIITSNRENAVCFEKLIDSAAVYVNASTRFTDGAEFGLGCEMGISTQKIGARGPIGLKELTSYKYVIEGQGQIR